MTSNDDDARADAKAAAEELLRSRAQLGTSRIEILELIKEGRRELEGHSEYVGVLEGPVAPAAKFAHPNTVHQEIYGHNLKLYVNVDVDPRSSTYDAALIEDLLNRAYKYMKAHSLTNLELEKTISQ